MPLIWINIFLNCCNFLPGKRKGLANKVLLGHSHTHSFLFYFIFLSVVYCRLQQQSWVVVTENFSKLKYLLTGLLQKKFAYPWCQQFIIPMDVEKKKGKWMMSGGVEGGALTMVGEMNASKQLCQHSFWLVSWKQIKRFLSFSICFWNISEYYH